MPPGEHMAEQWRLKHLYHTIINAKNVGETVTFYEMLDFIEWLEPRAAFPTPSPTTIPRVIAFRTENVRQAHKDLKAKGVRFTTEEPTSIPDAGITGCIVAYDPNGTLIEMIELEPGLRHSKIKEVFTPGVKC